MPRQGPRQFPPKVPWGTDVRQEQQEYSYLTDEQREQQARDRQAEYATPRQRYSPCGACGHRHEQVSREIWEENDWDMEYVTDCGHCNCNPRRRDEWGEQIRQEMIAEEQAAFSSESQPPETPRPEMQRVACTDIACVEIFPCVCRLHYHPHLGETE